MISFQIGSLEQACSGSRVQEREIDIIMLIATFGLGLVYLAIDCTD